MRMKTHRNFMEVAPRVGEPFSNDYSRLKRLRPRKRATESCGAPREMSKVFERGFARAGAA